MNLKINSEKILELAQRVLKTEAAAVLQIAENIDETFINAVSLLLSCSGKTVVSGIGKSGHIARKMAATLASTGTPAFFVHPTEASHGDLGMITANDVFVAISNSGETAELLRIMPLIKRMGIKLLAITSNRQSSLAELSDIHLTVTVEKEACPFNLVPTASTTAVLALGDALAISVLDSRGFSMQDFATSHPSGALGQRLLTRVSDVMRSGDDLPTVKETATVADALFEITAKRLGMTAVLDTDKRVIGIFTDGDLRRIFSAKGDFRQLLVRDVMTTHPLTMHRNHLATEALEIMERKRVNQILVVDEAGVIEGALNMHDLFAAKVV